MTFQKSVSQFGFVARITAASLNRALSAGLRPRNHRVTGFAEACVNGNLLADLIDQNEVVNADDWQLSQEEALAGLTVAAEHIMFLAANELSDINLDDISPEETIGLLRQQFGI